MSERPLHIAEESRRRARHPRVREKRLPSDDPSDDVCELLRDAADHVRSLCGKTREKYNAVNQDVENFRDGRKDRAADPVCLVHGPPRPESKCAHVLLLLLRLPGGGSGPLLSLPGFLLALPRCGFPGLSSRLRLSPQLLVVLRVFFLYLLDFFFLFFFSPALFPCGPLLLYFFRINAENPEPDRYGLISLRRLLRLFIFLPERYVERQEVQKPGDGRVSPNLLSLPRCLCPVADRHKENKEQKKDHNSKDNEENPADDGENAQKYSHVFVLLIMIMCNDSALRDLEHFAFPVCQTATSSVTRLIRGGCFTSRALKESPEVTVPAGP